MPLDDLVYAKSWMGYLMKCALAETAGACFSVQYKLQTMMVDDDEFHKYITNGW